MDRDSIIATAMLNHLNSWPDKPSHINLEIMEKAPIQSSMAMQQLSGTVINRKYIDGSFTGYWPFAIYVRISGTDTAKRLDAVKTLDEINAWLQDNPLPNLGDNRVADEIEMTSLPAVAATYEDGSTDYQAIFRLNYKQKRSDP